MSDVSFQDHIESTREKLTEARQRCLEARQEAEDELAEIDREFAAIEAYDAAKTGKRAAHAKSGAAPRAKRSPIREGLLNLISAAPAGMSRGEILDHMGIKGDKSAEMSVSNALTALTNKTGQLVREGGKYHAPADVLREAAE